MSDPTSNMLRRLVNDCENFPNGKGGPCLQGTPCPDGRVLWEYSGVHHGELVITGGYEPEEALRKACDALWPERR